ncbi:hypothetical protein SAMN06272739_0462 [Blastococcus haudaquaticus]|uniref:Uncharacterized protein n=2 Tax=Blastococcus haudaquaticus TaxID=1938745 RepID=A0A286GED4_9ACTN|nr:hypothetical protein SAMN06272739_0462 [Blastococcus haudaquaticus]
MDLHMELREMVFKLLAGYECIVEQVSDYIAVDGGSQTCRFRIDLQDRYVMVDAGAEGEFVFEVTIETREGQALMMSAISSLVEWKGVDAVRRIGRGRLSEYSAFRSV